MKLQEDRSIAGICLMSLSLLALCDTAAARPPARGLTIRSGPPAHAPAYGYRRQQIGGFDLVFDVGLGVYVAVGVTDVYYHEGRFYRCRAGVWEISLRGVTWEASGIDRLPPGLQVKAKSMLKLNGNGNSLVKLNGNGNSLVKLNGNDNGSNGNAGKPNGPAGAAKPAGSPDGNAGKSAGNSDSTTGKPNSAPDAASAKANGAVAAGAGKPTANAGANLSKAGANSGAGANKPATKAAASPKPAGKGKKK